MKILKPGKVEQRKFVCQKCGCEFVANELDFSSGDSAVKIKCPWCWRGQRWDDGEPYEEPTPTQTDRERLAQLVGETPDVKVWPAARLKISDYLIASGVTFREG